MKTNFQVPTFNDISNIRPGTLDGRHTAADVRRQASTLPTNYTPPGSAPRGWPSAIERAGNDRVRQPPGEYQPVDGQLPEAARAKLARLRDQTADAYAVLHAIADERRGLIDEQQRLVQRLSQLRRQGCGADHPSTIDAQSKHDDLAAQVSALNERAARHEPPRILATLDSYLRRLGQHIAITEHPPVQPKLLKGEAPLQAIDRIRQQIAELGADLRAVVAAPQPSSVVRATITTQVEALAARGRPDVLRMIEVGGPLAFSVEHVQSTVQGHAVAEGAPQVVGIGTHQQHDAMALFAWLFRDELMARLMAEVDDLADDAAALTDAERADRERALLGQILDAERHEEALIELAEQGGAVVDRRPNADPRAVLGLSSDLPAPRD